MYIQIYCFTINKYDFKYVSVVKDAILETHFIKQTLSSGFIYPEFSIDNKFYYSYYVKVFLDSLLQINYGVQVARQIVDACHPTNGTKGVYDLPHKGKL